MKVIASYKKRFYPSILFSVGFLFLIMPRVGVGSFFDVTEYFEDRHPVAQKNQWEEKEKHIKTHLEIGDQHFKSGFFYPAICHYTYGLRDIRDGNPEIKGCLLFRRAVAGAKYSKNYRQALRDINASLNPNIPTTPDNRWTRLINKTNICLKMGRQDDAVAAFEEAKDLKIPLNEKKQAQYLHIRSKIHEIFERNADAIQDLELISFNPTYQPDNFMEIQRALFSLYWTERAVITQTQLDRAINHGGILFGAAQNPGIEANILLRRAELYIRRSGTGDETLALGDLGELLKNYGAQLNDDQRLRILGNQSLAHLKQGDLEQGVEYWRAYRSFVPLPDAIENQLQSLIRGIYTLRKIPLPEGDLG